MSAAHAPIASSSGKVSSPLIALFYEIARNRDRRKQLAKVSLAFFAWYYLRQNGRPLAIPAVHLEWYKEIGTGKTYRRRPYYRKKTQLLAPRNHGKTIVAGFVVPLHRILFNRNVRTLLVSKTADEAIKRLRRLRTQLERNKLILDDFGGELGFRDPSAPWTDSYFQVRREDLSLVDPTVAAVGRGGAITGGRFDLIIGDDPEDDESVMSAQSRRRTRTWWKATVQELLEPWGEIILIGTRKHADDLYATCAKDPTYRTRKFEAILEWPDAWEWLTDDNGTVIGAQVTRGKSKVLWPELWPIEALLVKRQSMTKTLFERENQNNVVSDEETIFQLAWLLAAKERGETQPMWRRPEDVPADYDVIIAIDPAFVDDIQKAAEGDTDYTVALVIAVNRKTWHRKLIGGFRVRGVSYEEMRARLIDLGRHWSRPTTTHPAGPLRYIAVENNSLGKMYEIGLRRDTDFPLVPHSTTSKKADPRDGIEAMSLMFENGIFDFVNGEKCEEADRADDEHMQLIDVLMDELHGLGTEPHDDCVLALWIGECLIRRMRKVEEKKERGRPISKRERDRRAGRNRLPRSSAQGRKGKAAFGSDDEAEVDVETGSGGRDHRRSRP